MVDISDPRRARWLGRVYGNGLVTAFSNSPYVGLSGEYLLVYDVSEPLIPRLSFVTNNPAFPQVQHAYQNRRFFAAPNMAWSVDVSNTDVLGTYRVISTNWSMVVFEGNHAYASMTVLLPDGSFSTQLHVFELGPDGGATDLGDTGFSLFMDRLWPMGDGSRRFLATGSLPGIHTVDLSDPKAPVLLATYLPISGETRFVHSLGSHIQLAGRLGDEILLVKPDGRLEQVEYRRTALSATSLDRTESRLAVTEPASGLHLFDITRTNEFIPLGFLPLHGARDVRMDDRSAFVLLEKGLAVVDIRQPDMPVVRTNFALLQPGKLWLEGSRLYVQDGGIKVYDVSQPETTVAMGQGSIGWADNTTVAGGFVFSGYHAAAPEDRGVRVMDLRDPAKPVEMPRLYASESVRGLNSSGGLVRAVLADPFSSRQPRLVTIEAGTQRELSSITFDGTWTSYQITFFSSFMLLNNSFGTLFDISNPETPVRPSFWPDELPLPPVISRGNDLIQFFSDGRLQRSFIDNRNRRNFGMQLSTNITLASPSAEVGLTLPPEIPRTIELVSGPAIFNNPILTVTNSGHVTLRISVPGDEQNSPEVRFYNIYVGPAPQNIRFIAPATIPNATPTIALDASASSGLPVRYVVTSGPGSVAGNLLTITNPGPVTVYAIQDGDDLYLPAVSQPRTIELFDPVCITTQPKPVWVAPGSPFSLSVGFTGSPPTTTWWFRNDVFLTETGNTLEVAEANTNLTGLYHVVVANRIGAVTSHWVTVGVGTPPGGMTFVPRGTAPFQSGTAIYQAPGRVRLRGNIAAVVSKGVSTLNLYDVSDPDSPTLLSRTATTYTDPEDVGLLGDHAYVAIRNRGIRIIDISNLAQPAGVTTFVIPTNRSDVVTLTIRGELAYVANGTFGLCILDLQNRTNPAVVGSLALTGIAASVHLDGNKAYIPSWDGGVHIVDVTDPANPVLIRRLRDTASSYDSILTGGFLQVADYSDGLKTWDPENPGPTGPLQRVRNGLWTIARSEHFLFGANDGLSGRGYLSLFHLADPSRPVSLGYTKASDRIGGVTYRDGRLYLVGKNFSIVDVHEYFPGPEINASAHGTSIRLSWPASATNYFPEAADGVGGNLPWQQVTVPVVTEGTTNRMDLPIDRTSRVFRLRRDGE